MKINPLLLCAGIMAFMACASSGNLSKTDLSSPGQILKDVSYLASDELEGRETGSPGAERAAEYIAKRMQDLHLRPLGDEGSYFQEFAISQLNPHDPNVSASIVRGKNVIGYLDKDGAQTIVIGAHYDHLGYGGAGSLHFEKEPAIHNGADDNASGVAGMLYLADECRKRFPNDNFVFIAFAGEERGILGSNYFVKNPTYPLSQVDYMINLDMVGRLNPEKSLAVNGVGTSPSWTPAIESIQTELQIVPSESGVGPSDHTSFYYESVPALHFFTGQHEDYHKPSDDVDKVNIAGIESVMQFILSLMEAVDDDGKLAFSETQDSTQSVRSDFKVTLGVMPDYLFNGAGMRIDGVRPDRPASKAGLQKGDVIMQMGDISILDMMSYMEALQSFAPGQTIKVIIEREGKQMEKDVTFD